MAIDPVTAFAEKAVKANARVCRTVKQACQRHLDDLRRKDLEWRPDEVESVVSFFSENVKHYKGELAFTPLELEPWQVFGLGSVFGWFLDDGRRRYRESYWEIPRGNGKTAVAAGVVLYGALLDGEAAPECYTVATKEDQAKLAWRDATRYVAGSPNLRRLMVCRQKEIRCPVTDGFIKPLGSDSTTLDGLNPHVVVADEIHEWRDDKLYNVLKTAMVKRRRPLMFSITTAGFNCHGFGAQVHETGRKVIDPDAKDWTNDRFFYYLWGMDDPAKWRDKKQWFLANPQLGKSLLVEDLEESVRTANQPPNSEREVKVKRLNHWGADESKDWLPLDKWKACGGAIPEGAWEGRPAFLGLDLAEVHDLTALVAYSPPLGDDPALMRAWFWCPSENIRDRTLRDGVPYEAWSEAGLITVIPGEVTDFHIVERDVAAVAESIGAQSIGIDPWKGKDLAQRLADNHALDVVEVRQGFATMSPLCNELLRVIKGGLVRHGDNPILNWMAGNVTVRLDPAGNVKLDKAKSRERIDGMVAAAMAVGVAMEGEENNPYNSPDFGGGIFL